MPGRENREEKERSRSMLNPLELENESKLLKLITNTQVRVELEQALRWLHEQMTSISRPYSIMRYLITKDEVESIEEWCKIVERRITDYKKEIPEEVQRAIEKHLAEVRKKYPIVEE